MHSPTTNPKPRFAPRARGTETFAREGAWNGSAVKGPNLTL